MPGARPPHRFLLNEDTGRPTGFMQHHGPFFCAPPASLLCMEPFIAHLSHHFAVHDPERAQRSGKPMLQSRQPRCHKGLQKAAAWAWRPAWCFGHQPGAIGHPRGAFCGNRSDLGGHACNQQRRGGAPADRAPEAGSQKPSAGWKYCWYNGFGYNQHRLKAVSGGSASRGSARMPQGAQ